MEGQILAYEPTRTIEEANSETFQKMLEETEISLENFQNFNCKPEPAIQEKLDVFRSIFAKKSDHVFNLDRNSMTRNQKFKSLEKEIRLIGEEIEEIPRETEHYAECVDSLREVTESLKAIKEKSAKNADLQRKTKLEFPKSERPALEKLSSGLNFQVDITRFEEYQRINTLQLRISEYEKILGGWEDPSPVSKAISDLLLKTYFLNENMLEKLKEKTRKLGGDLDTMLSSSSNVNANNEVTQIIEKLHDEVFVHTNAAKIIPDLIKKLKTFQSVFIQSIDIENKLESLKSDNVLISQRVESSLEDLKDIKEGIVCNKKGVGQSISTIREKISRI